MCNSLVVAGYRVKYDGARAEFSQGPGRTRVQSIEAPNYAMIPIIVHQAGLLHPSLHVSVRP